MTGAVASHYAHALADAVFSDDQELPPQDAVQQLASAAALVKESKQLESALLSPAVNRNQKSAVINELADRMQWHRLIRNFFLLLVSHRRTKELAAIRDEFEAAVDERTGWLPAQIASAQALSEDQKKQIEQALGNKLGKRIRAHYAVDENLLAGVRARAGGVEYDASLRGKLNGLRSRLAAAH